MRRIPTSLQAAWLAIALAAAGFLAAQVTFPTRPGPRTFLLDQAELIEAADREQIAAICNKLMDEERIPIVVVTIPSLAAYNAAGLSIEAYARSLFDTWGIGSQERDYGVLLLVSKGDRKARIELGAAWAHAKDSEAQRIMDGIIIANFKTGRFSAGIVQGVQALDSLARGMAVNIPRPWWQPVVFIGLLVLGVAVAISLITSGRQGWGWGLLGLLFAVTIGLLFWLFRRSRGESAYGGGHGGGGGATGSW